MPVQVQNAGITAWGIHSRYQRYGAHFRRSLAWLKESEWWSRERIDAYQRDALRAMVAHAYQTSPYYRRAFDAERARPDDVRTLEDLASLPLLAKATARANAGDLVDASLDPRRLRVVTTSGTTGSPLRVLLTPDAQQLVWAIAWRHRARFGLALGDRFVTFGARLPIPDADAKPPLWRTNHAIGQAYLSVHHLTPATMPAVVAWLDRKRFPFFAGYPSAMLVLARFMADRGLSLRDAPKCVATGSETLAPDDRALLARTFRAPVTELYGMGEGLGGYSRCEAGGFHLDFEQGIVELLPAPEMSDPAIRRIVITGLVNRAMPFLRYETGDHARITDRACTCGRESPTIESIDGRIEDSIRTPDGRRVIGMNQVFKWAPSLREAQIVQERIDAIEVLYVATGSAPHEELKRVREELGRRLGSAMRIEMRAVDAIPRAANGKLRIVVSRIADTGIPR